MVHGLQCVIYTCLSNIVATIRTSDQPSDQLDQLRQLILSHNVYHHVLSDIARPTIHARSWQSNTSPLRVMWPAPKCHVLHSGVAALHCATRSSQTYRVESSRGICKSTPFLSKQTDNDHMPFSNGNMQGHLAVVVPCIKKIPRQQALHDMYGPKCCY